MNQSRMGNHNQSHSHNTDQSVSHLPTRYLCITHQSSWKNVSETSHLGNDTQAVACRHASHCYQSWASFQRRRPNHFAAPNVTLKYPKELRKVSLRRVHSNDLTVHDHQRAGTRIAKRCVNSPWPNANTPPFTKRKSTSGLMRIEARMKRPKKEPQMLPKRTKVLRRKLQRRNRKGMLLHQPSRQQ